VGIWFFLMVTGLGYSRCREGITVVWYGAYWDLR
jgi:hypothetical protein